MRAGFIFAGAAAMALAGFGTSAPAAAQAGTRVLTIFGNDKCPTSNGEEVVVCNRLPEGDRFRIPETLRTTEDTAPPATRRLDAMNVTGSPATGNCSAGNASQTGCQLELNRAWKADKRAQAATTRVPED